MKPLNHHPLADLFPMITGDEFAAFVADIKANGLQRACLKVKDGRGWLLADGRTRQLACAEAGIECRYEEWDGKGDLLDVICSLNLKSRHMSKTDLAVSADQAVRHVDQAVADAFADADMRTAKLQTMDRKVHAAAHKFGVSPRYVYQVQAIRRGNHKIYRELLDRSINLSQAINRVDRDRRAKDQVAKSAAAKIPKNAWKLIVGDAIQEMDRLPAGCAEVIFADPPYNNGWVYDSDPTGDSLNDGEYLDWMQAVINSAARLLSNAGSLFVLIDDRYSDPLGMVLRKSGLFRRNTIVWWETFGVHQTGNFSKCARYLHYFTKSPKGFTWHPEPIESARQRLGDARANVDGKCPDNVWQIPRVNGNDSDRVPFADAPPQVPVDLPLRAILAASEPGGLVVDCFNGNGTTALAALLAGRRAITIERSAKYAEQSEQWVKAQVAMRKDGGR